ncbi:MAG: TIGR00266 family protein [Armatimonadota bacterium]
MNFQVVGDVMQAVIVQMGAGEEVRAEAGSMLFMTDGVQMDTQMSGGLFGGLKRMLVGESLFIPYFRCQAPQAMVAFASPTPGKVRQLDLMGQSWICQRDSYLFSGTSVEISIAFTKKLGAGFFGGEGFILQRLSGHGPAFISGGGNFVEYTLGPGQRIKVDTGCIVGFEESVQYDIQFVGGFKNTLFGGEGLFLATLTGPGQIILQTLPFSRLAGRITGATTEGSSGLGGVAGTFGDLGRMFGGGD